jgi:hypothetical protein
VARGAARSGPRTALSGERDSTNRTGRRSVRTGNVEGPGGQSFRNGARPNGVTAEVAKCTILRPSLVVGAFHADVHAALAGEVSLAGGGKGGVLEVGTVRGVGF